LTETGRVPGRRSAGRDARANRKLIKFWEGPRELYNLRDDLAEETNFAEEMPGMVAELEALLDQRLKSQVTKLPRPNPDYAGN
jgi:hypothetical protein